MVASDEHARGQDCAPQEAVALIKPSLVREVASHTTMGVAVVFAFAFLVTHITALGIATLINYSPDPDAAMRGRSD
jgi:hypothetical protein